MRASDARAISVARSGVSVTNALSARALSIAPICAAVNSEAEKDFFLSASRASPRVNEFKSLTARAHPAQVVPPVGPPAPRRQTAEILPAHAGCVRAPRE